MSADEAAPFLPPAALLLGCLRAGKAVAAGVPAAFVTEGFPLVLLALADFEADDFETMVFSRAVLDIRSAP
jgi:hypothetical protein